MRPLIADENIARKIVRGIMKDAPHITIYRVQRVGLSGYDDPAVLQWSAESNGIMMSHDYATMPYCAYERIKAGLPMTGVLMVPQTANLKQMIEEIILSLECLPDEEWDNRVRYLPL